MTQATFYIPAQSVVIPELTLELDRNRAFSVDKISDAGNGFTTGYFPMVKVYWTGEDKTFLSYEPKVFLERFKPVRTKRELGANFQTNRKWVHPTHLNGFSHAGENAYGGTQNMKIGAPLFMVPDKETEWTCPSNSYQRVKLNVDPNLYFHFSGPEIRMSGWGYKRSEKTAYFRATIVIRDRTKTGKDSYIWGPRSSVFGFRPYLASDGAKYWNAFTSTGA